MKECKILGLDPGFANIGYSVVSVTKSSIALIDAGVFRTEKSDKKRKILATDDNLRRTLEIVKFLDGLCSQHSFQYICAESMSFPRNSSAAAKMAMAWGVIATLAYKNGIALLQASPQEIKVALCGVKSASKEEIKSAVQSKLDVMSKIESLAGGVHEHAYDATAAVMTCVRSPVFSTVRNMLD